MQQWFSQNHMKLNAAKTQLLVFGSPQILRGMDKVALTLQDSIIHESTTVFALERIPVGEEEICMSEDVEKWPHLRDVVPKEISADIGVLVGVNVPEALKPTEFIPSVGKCPFAAKTRLSWVNQWARS